MRFQFAAEARETSTLAAVGVPLKANDSNSRYRAISIARFSSKPWRKREHVDSKLAELSILRNGCPEYATARAGLVGAHFGLIARRLQPGETDYEGGSQMWAPS